MSCRAGEHHDLSIKMGEQEGFNSVLNSAAYQTHGDFLVVGDGAYWSKPGAMSSAREPFARDTALGMIRFIDPESEVLTTFMMPIERILEIGLFDYSNAALCIEDMKLKLQVKNLEVKTMHLAGDSLEGSVFSHQPGHEMKARFSKTWTNEPRSHLKSITMLGLGKAYALDPKQRLNVFEKALELSPESSDINLEIGVLCLREFRTRAGFLKAIRHLRHAWESDPRDPTAGLPYALALRVGRQEDQAMMVLKGLLEGTHSSSTEANIHQQIAKLNEASDLERAIYHYSESIRLDGQNPVAVHGLVALMKSQGRITESVKMLTEFLVNHEDASIYSLLGECYLALEDPEKAYSYYLTSCELNWNNRGSVLGLVISAKALGYPAEILRFIKMYLEDSPNDTELMDAHHKLVVVCNSSAAVG